MLNEFADLIETILLLVPEKVVDDYGRITDGEIKEIPVRALVEKGRLVRNGKDNSFYYSSDLVIYTRKAFTEESKVNVQGSVYRVIKANKAHGHYEYEVVKV